MLRQAGIDTAPLRSKSWDEFSGPGAPALQLVITVCDSAAAEPCPVFYGGSGGAPLRVHWSYPDPSGAEGDDAGKRRAFELTRQVIGYRMLQLLDLLSRPEQWTGTARADLQAALEAIGKS